MHRFAPNATKRLDFLLELPVLSELCIQFQFGWCVAQSPPPLTPKRGGTASPIAHARHAATDSPLQPICLALCTPPASSTCRAHAASRVHVPGPRSATPTSRGIILAATNTFSSGCVRLAMSLCLHLWCAVGVCARACASRCTRAAQKSSTVERAVVCGSTVDSRRNLGLV